MLRSLLREPLTGGRAVLVLGTLLVMLGVGLDALWIEPRLRLETDTVTFPLDAAPLRLAHLSDLHIRGGTPVLDRLLEEVAAARPRAVVISGDLLGGRREGEALDRHLATATAWIRELRRTAPILAVQGHSEYRGDVVAAFAEAGVRWLSHEGVLLGDPDRPVLLLGLNQQVGWNARPRPDGSLVLPGRPIFRLTEIDGASAVAALGQGWQDNSYLHYDPLPRPLQRTDGPLAWSGVELSCQVYLLDADAGAGVAVHSRYPVGEDRMIRLRRVAGPRALGPGINGSFQLVLHGSDWTEPTGEGSVDTGVAPRAGRWYGLRLRTTVTPEAVRAQARVWPADEAEPTSWQAVAEDASPRRVTAGTVSLWGWEEAEVAYRDLRVTDGDGRLLLDEPFRRPDEGEDGAPLPAGWREGARASRLALALARSPAVPAGTPRIVLSHTPSVVLEASHRGMEAVLAGHTHGGQIRLPFLGALTTRSLLGAHYDYGLFHFAAPNARGATALYVNAGVGTSVLPIRFLDPPRWAVVEVGR